MKIGSSTCNNKKLILLKVFFIPWFLGKTSQTLSGIARNDFWCSGLKIVFITTTSQIIIFEDNPNQSSEQVTICCGTRVSKIPKYLDT